MNDPYNVLGVDQAASLEEIRGAYLRLVKKYHPDKYTDTDLKELANEKLVEVNEAYSLLTKTARRGTSADAYGASGTYYSGSGGAYSGEGAVAFAEVRECLNKSDLDGAKRILDTLSIRNAQWYYLYGIVYLRQGWYDKANEYITRAYQQESANPEYSSAYRSVRNIANTSFTRRPRRSNRPRGKSGMSACDVCTGLVCADCCCECMGGDLIRCC